MHPSGARCPEAVEPSVDLLHALGWYCVQVIGLERLFRHVTVKRRRNLDRPVKRRKSAFRDPVICGDFLAMAWLGATRLSFIEQFLESRPELAVALSLPRFCDHTTAHKFLNAFHATHLRQLDEANERLLREHGSGLGQGAPVLDIDVAERRVRHLVRRASTVYRWAVAFSAGEAVAQDLGVGSPERTPVAYGALARARAALGARPRLVRLAPAAATPVVLRELARARVPFLTTASWQDALAGQLPDSDGATWADMPDGTRVLDLGSGAASPSERRVVLVERPAAAPGLRAARFAVVTSLLHAPALALPCLAGAMCRIKPFFGHERWPLSDGKLPSSRPRGNAAYLRLATIAMNILRLFARQLGGDWTPSRVQAQLRAIAT